MITKQPTVAGDTATRYVGTREEIKAVIRKQPAKTRFYLSVRADAPIEGSDTEQGDRAFIGALFTSVKISKKDALFHVGYMLSDIIEHRGGRIESRSYPAPSSVTGGAFYVV